MQARTADVDVAAGAVGEGHATCAPGELAVGGGAYLLGTDAAGDRLLESGPVVVPQSGPPVAPSGDDDPNGWFASAENAAGQPRVLKVIAQCQQ